MKTLLSAKAKMEFYVDAVKACGGEADALYCPDFSDEYDGSKVFEYFLGLCEKERAETKNLL